MWIGFVIARAAAMDETWTTIHLAVQATQMGHTVAFIEPWDWEIDARSRLLLRAHVFSGDRDWDESTMVDHLVRRVAARRVFEAQNFGLVFLRAAPIRPDLLTLGSMMKERGIRVVNDPEGILRVSHKAWLAAVEGAHVPKTLVTRSRGSAHAFYAEQADGVVCKPARASGGKGVQRVAPGRPSLLDEALDIAVREGIGHVVLQTFVPESRQGEKRLVVVDGQVLGGYLRRSVGGDFRHNLKQGAKPEALDVSSRDHACVAPLAGPLKAAGIRFAGVDVIGDTLIEVNVMNPGGTYYTDQLCGSRVAEQVIQRLVNPAPPGSDGSVSMEKLRGEDSPSMEEGARPSECLSS